MGGCPSPSALEAFAHAAVPDEAVRLHVEACPGCRAAVEEIRDNDRFLTGLRAAVGEASGEAVPGPDVLPGYRIVDELHRGGQGVVYRAIQLQTRRTVAIKMLLAGALASTRQRERFEREARLAASLRHPNIVTVYDSGPLPDGRYALAMEYIEGATLDRWSRALEGRTGREARRRTLHARLRVMVKVCDAVLAAHQRAIVHRDLKPANILVDGSDEPHVLDFGIAKQDGPADANRLTHTGEFAGTLAYASPEQVSGDPERIDTRTDIYSLGVVMYELVTGLMPYDVRGPLQQVVTAIESVEPASPSVGDRPIDADVSTIILKALAKEPYRRYQTAGDLRADLERYLAGEPIEARRDSTWYVMRKAAARHRVAVVAAGLVFALVVVFAAAMAWQAHRLRVRGRELSAALVGSARMLAGSGAAAQAEEMLWRELARTGYSPDDPGLGLDSPPEVMRPAWALFELYSHMPRVMSVRTPEVLTDLAFAAGGRRVSGRSLRIDSEGFGRIDGSSFVWSLDDGRIAPADPALSALEGPNIRICGYTRSKVLVWREGVLRAVDPASGAIVASMALAVAPANPRLSADGRYMSNVTAEGELELWDLGGDRIERIATLDTGLEPASATAFSTDGTRLAALCDRATIRIWDVPRRSLEHEVTPPLPMPPVGSAQRRNLIAGFAPNGRWVALRPGDSAALVPSSGEGAGVVLAGHTGSVQNIGFTADSRLAVTASVDRTLKVWEVESGRAVASVGPLKALPPSTAISPDGMLVIASERERTLNLWETMPRRWLTRVQGHSAPVVAVRMDSTGHAAASGGDDGSLVFWDADALRPVRTIPGAHGGGVQSVDFSPDGRAAVSLGGDGVLRAWDVAGSAPGRVLAQGLGHGWGSVRFSPDGRSVAATDNGAAVVILDAASGTVLTRLVGGHMQRIPEIDFSPDGRTLATVSVECTAALWDVATGTVRARLTGFEGWVRAVCFSRDGSLLATGADGGTIRLWDVATGRLVRLITGVGGDPFSLAFHPKGRLLFSGTRDGALQVWDPESGSELARLESGGGSVFSLAVSPDGRTLASTGRDGSVGFWNLTYYQRHVRGNAAVLQTAEPLHQSVP